MKLKTTLLLGLLSLQIFAFGETVVTISNPETWAASSLNQYQGKTIRFATPFYICNNYYSSRGEYTISPRRIFAPTNQAVPHSLEYSTIVSANSTGEVRLAGIDGYHRMGEKIYDLTVKVNSTSQLTVVGTPTFVGNTRAELSAGYPSVDMRGEHSLLVCTMNLEYYLVENLGTGYGPEDQDASDKQHAKISQALDHIRADIFGFVEVEQGQAALQKLANTLTQKTGKTYSWINDGGSASGSYTKSGYVYCTQTVKPIGNMYNNNTGVNNRKKVVAFQELSSGETFIFSLNHFKAKSGSGTGLDADQGDGQGIFNNSRVIEAESVLEKFETQKAYYGDSDILLMGDLNSYAKEDPIRVFTDAGMIDMHRFFHADSSYSYVFHDQAGYLDHAIANESLLKQVTGMRPYHINSDEKDAYTYDKSNDKTMFRCSDHDPILVGLRLGADMGGAGTHDPAVLDCDITMQEGHLRIQNAEGGIVRLYNIMGGLVYEQTITSDDYLAPHTLTEGFYIADVYAHGAVKQQKLMLY